MEQIEAAFRDVGITVPLSHNEKGQRSVSWSTDYQNVGGAVNVYGLDSCKCITLLIFNVFLVLVLSFLPAI